mmetsp:Transcript_23288/g.45236  ORF Transcript_23288/g.45236 Transcript_23288/m.45236 type:complete len:253 (+) Transcript_23288:277-1035(+)
MSSLKSSFSSLRCSVASTTILSNSLIPAFKASISSPNFVMSSLAFSMAISKSETARSKPFFLSSAWSNAVPQYSFLASSSACSTFRVVIMSSIILITFSKPIFLPFSASINISSFGFFSPLDLSTLFNKDKAARRESFKLNCTCIRLAALGNVFLKSSKASSSFRTLMVSASAASSSARVFTMTSHSFFFVSQFLPKFAINSLSAMRASSVSPRSFFIWAISTPKAPTLSNLVSICFVNAATSFFFFAINFS